MYQHSPKQIPVLLGSGALPNGTNLASIGLSQNIPPGGMVAFVIQGASTAATAVTTTIFGKGDEQTVSTAGPFSYDAGTAAYIRWGIYRYPTGLSTPFTWLFSGSANWPATTYISIVYLQNSSQFLGYSTTARAAGANVIFTPTYTLGGGTVATNAYRNSTVELLFNTNAAAQAWNGLGNTGGMTPDASTWTQFVNGAGTGLGLINIWAAFSQRPVNSTAVLGRYATAVNTHETWLRFGGG
jgi:hypothetical protein